VHERRDALADVEACHAGASCDDCSSEVEAQDEPRLSLGVDMLVVGRVQRDGSDFDEQLLLADWRGGDNLNGRTLPLASSHERVHRLGSVAGGHCKRIEAVGTNGARERRRTTYKSAEVAM
jgi:hypothetical protein